MLRPFRLLTSVQAQAAAMPAQAIQHTVELAQEVGQGIDRDERETRRLIDAQLREAGWEADSETLSDAAGTRPQKGRNLAIAEWPTADGGRPGRLRPVRRPNHRRHGRGEARAVEAAIDAGRRDILVAMATGTGKTKTCIALVYRLLKAQRFRRILFLVDRTALGEQAGNAFKETRMEQQQVFDEYDCIVVDECHRGYLLDSEQG